MTKRKMYEFVFKYCVSTKGHLSSTGRHCRFSHASVETSRRSNAREAPPITCLECFQKKEKKKKKRRKKEKENKGKVSTYRSLNFKQFTSICFPLHLFLVLILFNREFYKTFGKGGIGKKKRQESFGAQFFFTWSLPKWVSWSIVDSQYPRQKGLRAQTASLQRRKSP